MASALTPRQQASLDKIRAQGNVAGIDKGMIRALVKKGHLEPALLPKPAAARIPRPDTKHPFAQSREQRCLDRIEECFKIAEEHFGREFPRPVVKFSNRMKKTAGTARWRWGRHYAVESTEIHLSSDILRLNTEEFIADTPGHEAAHLIALHVYGLHGKGHGTAWKSVMRLLGQAPERCHNMATMPTRKSKIFKYKATCGTIVELKQGRHNKIKRGMTYTLRTTGGKIDLNGFVGVA